MMKPIIKAPATWKDKLWATREVFRVNHQLKRYTLDDIIAEIQNISVVSNALPEEDMHFIVWTDLWRGSISALVLIVQAANVLPIRTRLHGWHGALVFQQDL